MPLVFLEPYRRRALMVLPPSWQRRQHGSLFSSSILPRARLGPSSNISCSSLGFLSTRNHSFPVTLRLRQSCYRHFSSGTKKGGHTSSSSSSLTRTQRRALERKRRNQERREQQLRFKQPSNIPATSQASSISTTTTRTSNKKWSRIKTMLSHHRLRSFFHPNVVGSGRPFQKEHLQAMFGWRLPLALGLTFVLADSSDYSPGLLQASLGPSMLPTIQFLGDIWWIDRLFWTRLVFWKNRKQQNVDDNDPSATATATVPTLVSRGQVVLWKDPKRNGRISCKRVIGVGGDKVYRFGEYAHLYQNQTPMYGIVWPQNQQDKEIDTSWDEDPQDIRVDRIYTVPPGHVWLEGDCPWFSLDSRHYGPIPEDWIYGKLVLRLWPLQDSIYFQDIASRQSLWIGSCQRPVPYETPDDYLGKPFNFYRIPKEQGNEDDGLQQQEEEKEKEKKSVD